MKLNAMIRPSLSILISVSVLFIARLTMFVPTALAQGPNPLDPSFGVGGIVTTDFGGSNNSSGAIAIQSDGKIVVAGTNHNGSNNDFGVVRYFITGTLDSSFGIAGIVTTAVGSSHDQGEAIAIQVDGKIVVAGSSHNGSNNDFGVVRYFITGTLDSSFGTGGIVTTAIGAISESGYAMAIQSDGKIVVAGYSNNGVTHDFAVVRYTITGTLDSSFGTGGIVTTPIGSSNDIGRAMAIQSDGKIVVAGFSNNGINDDFAVVRYNSNGSLDTTFDTDGKVTTPTSSGSNEGWGVAIQTDGKIVVAGHGNNGANYDFQLVRYNSNGSLDITFDSDGKVTTPIGSNTEFVRTMAIQTDGKILMAGYSNNGSNDDFAMVRYNGNGSLDNGFGVGGIVTTSIGSSDDRGQEMAIQNDSKIVVVGYSYNGSNNDFAVVRYMGDSCYATHNNGITVFSSTNASAVQQAASAASVGDTVKVAGYCAGVQNILGTNQTVNITKSITMQGGYTHTTWAFNPSLYPTTLDALGLGRVVMVTNTGVMGHLSNLKITNGVMSDTATCPSGCGGGVFAANDLTLTNMTFISNAARYNGGGAYSEHSLTIGNSYFKANSSARRGGGVGSSGTTLVITYTTFDNNFTSHPTNGGGGAVWANETTTVLINNAIFLNNTSAIAGGAIDLEQDGFISDSYFENNQCTSCSNYGGGAIYVSRTLVLSQSQFVGNNSQARGGAIFFDYRSIGSQSRLVNTLFANNHSVSSGMALYITTTGIVEIIHTTIASSTVGVTRQGIYMNGGTLFITNSIIANQFRGLHQNNGVIYQNYNLFAGNVTPITGTVNSGSNSITGTAAFYDTTNYTLTASSMAVDKGINLNITTDFEGEPRPQGSMPDMGYDESPYSNAPDLAIVKTVNPGSITLGNTITYTIAFTNIGSGMANNVYITDVMPISLTNLTYTQSASVLLTLTVSAPTYSWAMANLSSGQSGLITITAYVPVTSGVSSIANGVQITSTSDITPSNNVATVTLNITSGNCYANLNGTVYNSSSPVALQLAVLNASPGDTVKVAGTCAGVIVPFGTGLTQTLYISKPLTIQGGYTATNWTTSSSTNITTIDAQNLGRVIYAIAPVTLSDLRVQNGLWTVAGQHGGGIYTNQAITLTNVIVRNNGATGSNGSGGGLYVNNGLARVISSTFRNNNADSGGSGGGAYFLNNALVTQSTFDGNWGPINGGGAYFNTVAQVISSSFTNNQANSSGFGGGASFNGQAMVTATTFYNNLAQSGGGIYHEDKAMTLTNVLLDRNWVLSLGAAIYNGSPATSEIHIRHTTIASPTLALHEAIYNSGSGAIYITNSIIFNHDTGIYGGGTVIEDYNLYDNVPTIGVALGVHSLIGPAAFVNPIGFNYDLTAASAAVDRGINLGITTDFNGDVRPFNLGIPDLGYDESPFTALPDIAIIKKVNPGTLTAGNGVTYTIAFSNVGSGAGNNVYITDIIPSTLASVTYTANIPAVTSSVMVLGLTYSWSIPTLGVGQGGIITITAQLPVTASAGMIANTVQVTATGETLVGNNSATANLFVVLGSCYATADNGATVFSSSDATAVQSAVGAASVGGTVKVAGTCAGVQSNGGFMQTVYITRNVTLQGGFLPTSWITPSLANVTTLDAQGGGRVIYAVGSTVNVYGLKITNGVAVGAGSDGGGIYAPSSTVTLSGTLVISNVAGGSGGGIASNFTVISLNSDFINNTAQSPGSNGGAILASVNITGGKFQNNWAYDHGGAIDGSSIVVTGTKFVSNIAFLGHGGAIGSGGTVKVTNSFFEQNQSAAEGGAVASFNSLTVADSRFIGNYAMQNGGAIYGGTTTVITNSVILGNSANLGGGLHSMGSGQLINVLLAGNSAGTDGAAIYHGGFASLNILHATIVSPSLSSKQGVYVANGTVNITNSIIFNHAIGLEQFSAAIINENYNLFFNNTTNRVGVATGANSITGNPDFQNPMGGDYHLKSTSAAIDMGMNLGVTTDFEGQIRPQGGGYDLGYDESIFSNSPDVRIVKTVSPASAMPGDMITYTLTYSNVGSGLANNVRITDIIPPGIVLPMTVNTPAGVGPIAGFNYVWMVNPLAGGQGGVIVLQGQVAASASGSIVNTAQITGSGDVTLTNNSSSATLTVIPLQTNLMVSKVVMPTTGVADDIVTYTLSFMNQGPKAATNVILVDDLPMEITVLSVSMTGTMLTQNVNGNRYVWQGPSLPVGASGLITITAQIASSVATNTTIVNRVMISATEMDANMGDNAALAVVTVGNPQADVVLTKTVTPLVVAPGEAVTYTLEVSNHGPDTATVVLLNDHIPLGLRNLAWQASGITLTLNPGRLYSWRLPSMPAGSAGVVTVTGVVDPNLGQRMWLTNTASISTATPETDMTNNVGVAMVEVVPLVADLWLIKTALTPMALPGEWVTYTVEFGNSGAGVARGVLITDTMPSELINVSYINNGAPITPSVDITYSWQVANLPPDSGGIITLTGQVEPTTLETSFDNVVEISTAVDEADVTDNNSVATVMVSGLPLVGFSESSYEVGEAGGLAVITVTLSQPWPSEVSIDYEILDNTTLAGADYLMVMGTLVFTPGDIEQSFTVPILDDVVAEAMELVDLQLSNSVGAVLDMANANLTILDNDAGGVRVAPTAIEVTEGGATANYQVSLTSEPSSVVTVTLINVNGQATMTPLALIFTPTDWNISQTVTVSAMDDNVVEGIQAEVINHKVVTADPIYAAITLPNVIVTINDNDMPTVAFAQAVYQVAENGGQAVITVRLSATPWVTATVDYATITDTAVAGVDYGATQGRLVFSPGITQVNWTVAIIDDVLLESSETINMALFNPTNSILGSPDSAQLTILDNETPTTLTLTHNGATALGEVTTFTATLAGGSGGYSYSWDFGDGLVITTGTQFFVSHEYLAPGSYQVTVTATNGMETVTDILTITITPSVLSDLLLVKQELLMSVPVHQGEFITYRLTILNVSNIMANNVYITHTWSVGADGQPAFYGFALNRTMSLSVLQVTNQTANPCQLQQSELLCQVAALPAGSRATINLMLSPRLTGTLLSKIEATAKEVDPDISNNSVQTNLQISAPVTVLARQHGVGHQIYLPILVKE